MSSVLTLLGRPEPQFLLLRTGASDGASLTGPGGSQGGRPTDAPSRGSHTGEARHQHRRRADRSWVPTRPRGTDGPPDAPATQRPCLQACPASLSRSSPLWSNLSPRSAAPPLGALPEPPLNQRARPAIWVPLPGPRDPSPDTPLPYGFSCDPAQAWHTMHPGSHQTEGGWEGDRGKTQKETQGCGETE